MVDFDQLQKQIRSAASTQAENVFQTYSPLWTSFFAERDKGIEPDSLAHFLNPASHQTSGVAGQSTAPTLFAEFYAELVDEQLLDDYPMSPVGSPETFPFKGRPASVSYLENLAVLRVLLEMTRDLPRRLDIVEIGAGYGCMAYCLIRADAANSYTIIDLPENLINSAYYLSQNLPENSITVCADGLRAGRQGVNLVLPGHIDAIDDLRFDLAINTDSLGEMRAETAKAYVAWIHAHLRERGSFFSKNGHRRGGAEGVQRISEYGYQRFGLSKLRPPIAASSLFDDFSHFLLLTKNGAMPDDQIRQLDTLADLYALGLHAELEKLSERVAEKATDDEDRRFLEWAAAYFSQSPQHAYAGRFGNCADFMCGVSGGVNGKRRRDYEPYLMRYLQTTQSFAAEAYSNMLLARRSFSWNRPQWTEHNGAATRYFMREVQRMDRLPPILRWFAYRVRTDNLRKKMSLDWRPSGITKTKNLLMNMKEHRKLSFQR